MGALYRQERAVRNEMLDQYEQCYWIDITLRWI